MCLFSVHLSHVCVCIYVCVWCVVGVVCGCVYAIDYCCFESVGLQFLKMDYSVICDVLEPVITAKAKVSSST